MPTSPVIATSRPTLRPILLLVGFGSQERETVEEIVGTEVELLYAEREREALEVLDERDVAVVCLGEGVRDDRALRLVEEMRSLHPDRAPVFLVLAGGKELEQFQELIDQDALFYLSQEPVVDADLAAILRSAARRWTSARRDRSTDPGRPATEVSPAQRISRMQSALDAARGVALQRDLSDAGALVIETVVDLVDADRAHYLIYDSAEEVLRAGELDSIDERVESSAVGLVSFVVHAGRPVMRDRVEEDPRYEREADDPPGSGRERFLAVPMPSVGGRSRGVLVAVRAPHRPPFSEEDRRMLQMLAGHVGPIFTQLVLQQTLDAKVSQREVLGDNPLFRRQAIEANAETLRDGGDLLQLSPGWANWTYKLILVVVVAALAFSLLGSLSEYARGPALVRIPGHREVTAVNSGTVKAVRAVPGRQVMEGAVLVELHGAQEMAELRRLEREIEQQLLARLRDPSDSASARALIALRAQWDLARTRLEEKVIRSPANALVGGVRVRPGQHVGPGQVLVSLTSPEARPSVVALLPGQYLPQLEPGMPLRLEVQGYAQSYQHLEVDRVSDAAVGPDEARRIIGEDVASSLALAGPVVLVEARFGSTTFEVGGDRFRYHDGMYAIAEVPVRSDRILLALFPRLRKVWEAIGG